MEREELRSNEKDLKSNIRFSKEKFIPHVSVYEDVHSAYESNRGFTGGEYDACLKVLINCS
jgi:hypothetical protein